MQNKRIYDLSVMIVPLVILLIIVGLIVIFPSQSNYYIESIRNILGNDLGSYYLVLGFVVVIVSVYLALSKYGNIKLGNSDEPRFSTFSWATMIFTSTMAADILFYALHEWMYYWTSTPLDFNELTDAEKITWSESYSLFHWGVTPWIFYILPAVAYGYMMHIKGRNKQRVSEACRPVLKGHADKFIGKSIDIISILVLLIATSTTFSVATPLLSSAVCKVTGLNNSKGLTIIILCIIALIYTSAVLFGFKGISVVSTICIILCCSLAGIFLILGDTRFIIENGINSIGNMTQNFVKMSLWTDPARYTNFPQDWTVFYWAYWISWSVANPFFIAKISEGRTIKNVVLGGTLSGLLGTYFSFIIFGGFGIAEQSSGRIEVASRLADGESASDLIIDIFGQLPCTELALVVLVITMIGFYTTTFDSLTHVISSYSYKELSIHDEPSKFVKVYWSVLFILLPCALLFSESATYQLQGLAIIAAFPFSFITILVVVSFFKELRSNK